MSGDGDSTVVNYRQKSRSIDFRVYIFNKQKQAESTILTPMQREAIKKIEDYWIQRWKNARNWKFQKHFSLRWETVSTRVDETLYKRCSKENVSRKIQTFVRVFLRDAGFREEFLNRLVEDIPEEVSSGVRDITDFLDRLNEMFPRVLSGKLRNLEKELVTLYFTLYSQFSLSWAIRRFLIEDPPVAWQPRIYYQEVPGILRALLRQGDDWGGVVLEF